MKNSAFYDTFYEYPIAIICVTISWFTMLDIGSPSSEAASFFSSIGSTGFVPDCKFSIKVIKTAISADLVSSIAYFTNSYSKPISISSFEAVAISSLMG